MSIFCSLVEGDRTRENGSFVKLYQFQGRNVHGRCYNFWRTGASSPNIPIDEALIQEALAVANQQTERDIVEEALCEYVQRRKQRMIFDLFGTINYEADYNYKQQRQHSWVQEKETVKE